MRTVKVKEVLHARIRAVATELGIPPGDLVDEAVTFYLDNTRDQLMDRIQERLDVVFAKKDSGPAATELPPQGAVKEG